MSKSGFIAILGRPNVGKSTLLNALVGEKIAIVSNKPQTTRNRIMGVLTQEDRQFVFVDTPGMHMPKTKLGEYMVRSIKGAIKDVDSAVLVVDAAYPPGEIETKLLARLKSDEIPVVLAINKIDACSHERVGQCILEYAALGDYASVVPISALKNDGVGIILDELTPLLREEDFFFPEDTLTDQPEKQIASEIVREKILRLTQEEIPHGTAVEIETFEEEENLLSIRAKILCEKESHKRILIGKNGEMLKRIGTYAREDMERFFDVKVYLELWVKVKENWRDNPRNLSELGYALNKD